MNDPAIAPPADPAIAPPSAVEQTLAELERRVKALEARVAAIPDTKQIEEQVTERVKASLPPPAQPADLSLPPQLKDIAFPIPSAQAIVDTAKTTWALFEMINELKNLFWTLVDRRYHMAWLTRFITIGLLIAILTSNWWVPLASYDNIVSRVWDKIIDLVLGLILFMVLTFETRRYKEWRSKG